MLSNRFNSSKELIEDFVKNLVEKKYSEMWRTFEGMDKTNSGYIADEQFKVHIVLFAICNSHIILNSMLCVHTNTTQSQRELLRYCLDC